MASITVFVRFEVDPVTNGLKMNLQQLSISADSDDLTFNVIRGKGMFINNLRNMFYTFKDYTIKNINTLLQNFREPIQSVIDFVMDDI